jgi:predicted small lipoprotein YifL
MGNAYCLLRTSLGGMPLKATWQGSCQEGGVSMHHLNLLGYLMLPAMMALVTLAACAPRQPIEVQLPPSAKNEALSYKAPFGEARIAPPEIVAAGKALYEGKERCTLCHGISGKGDRPAAHMQVTHPPRDFTKCAFQKEREDGDCFGLSNTAVQAQGCNDSCPGGCRKRKGGRSWPMSEHFAPHSRSITLLGPSASRGTGSVTPSMRQRMRA